jgi:hypothetical protein
MNSYFLKIEYLNGEKQVIGEQREGEVAAVVLGHGERVVSVGATVVGGMEMGQLQFLILDDGVRMLL